MIYLYILFSLIMMIPLYFFQSGFYKPIIIAAIFPLGLVVLVYITFHMYVFNFYRVPIINIDINDPL